LSVRRSIPLAMTMPNVFSRMRSLLAQIRHFLFATCPDLKNAWRFDSIYVCWWPERKGVPSSALRDRRFEPISHKEVAVLQCTVSLLHGFERVTSWTEWTLGCHGLIIEFKGGFLNHALTCPACIREQNLGTGIRVNTGDV
jgi:hypothetical protein